MKLGKARNRLLVAALGLLTWTGAVFPVQAQSLLHSEAILISQGISSRVDVGRGTILEYNASNGTATFRDLTSGQVINTIPRFRKTWSAIIYIGDDRLFFYDHQAGEGEVYTVKQRRGELPLRLSRSNSFRKTWQQIHSPRLGYLTFIDSNRDVETYFVDSKGILQKR